MNSGEPLPASALAVCATGPTAGPTLALLEFLLGPKNSAFPGLHLFRIHDPANELITR